MVFTACATTCGVGLAPTTDAIATYPGQSGNAVGLFSDGSALVNSTSIGSSGVTWTTGDVIDVSVDLSNKTIQLSKNGGALSTALSISAMSGFNVSPACDVRSVSDACSFNGTPPTVFSGTSPWG
jgi:hypothetical protein